MFFCPLSDCCGFFPLVLTVLLTSRFVLSGSSARSCFCVSLHLPLCVQIPRASTRHLPFRVICGFAVDGSASRSDLRAASPASMLLPLLRLVPPWWSNYLRGRGFCPSLTARGSTLHLSIICYPNKPPLYPHLNPASPSWQCRIKSICHVNSIFMFRHS